MRVLIGIIIAGAFISGSLQAEPVIAEPERSSEAKASEVSESKAAVIPGFPIDPSVLADPEPFPVDPAPPFFMDELFQTGVPASIDNSVAEQLRRAAESSAILQPVKSTQNPYFNSDDNGTDYKLQQQIRKLADYLSQQESIAQEPVSDPPVKFEYDEHF